MIYIQNILLILVILLVFGVCIFVHELGHLLMALWRGLHVERFSVGFGKAIWSKTRNGVEYVIGFLPFGGYVALPQLEPTDTPTDKDDNPLPHAPARDRALTALAGPVANLVFGFMLACLVWWAGVYRPLPATECEVIAVPEASPEYEVGLRPGDIIHQVNNQPFTNGWSEVVERITLSTGPVSLQVRRNNESLTFRYLPEPNPEVENLGYPFFKVRTPIMIGNTLPGSPSAQAGILPGDIVLAVDDEPVEHAPEFIRRIAESEGKPLTVLVRRKDGSSENIPLRARAETVGDSTIYRIGAELSPPLVLTHLSPWSQFTNVVQQTFRTLRTLTARNTLVKPLHMSGPVGIVNVFWIKFTLGGWREGLSFAVFLCFALALVNLLPLPVLDGGHITFAGIEGLIGRRLPTKFMYYVQTAFALLLITFMLYVTFYDVRRVARIHHARSERAQQEQERTEQEQDVEPAAAVESLQDTAVETPLVTE